MDVNFNTENSNCISNSNTNTNPNYKKKIYNMLNSSRRKEREIEFSKEKDALLEMYFGEEYKYYENESNRKITTESEI